VSQPPVEAAQLINEVTIVGVISTLVLTGGNETPVTTNLPIKISSYQGTINRGEPSFISFVAPHVSDLENEIAARENGDLVLTRTLVFADSQKAPISSVVITYDDLRYDIGAEKGSLTISGRSTISFPAAKAVSVIRVIDRAQVIVNGQPFVNFKMDLKFLADINPGDTFTYAARDYQVSAIFYEVSVRNQIATLQCLDVTP